MLNTFMPQDIPDSPSYGGDGWSLEQIGINAALQDRSQSLFSLSNGFIGVRGGYVDGTDKKNHAGADVYLNGVYETVPISYHEKAHGFAETSDTRPPAANATSIVIHINGARVCPDEGTVRDVRRRLDFRTGILTRTLRWQAPDGGLYTLVYERIVSLTRRHIMAQRVRITAVDTVNERAPSHLTIAATIDAAHEETARAGSEDTSADILHDPRLGPRFTKTPWALERVIAHDGRHGFIHRLKKSGMAVAVAQNLAITGGHITGQTMPDRAGTGPRTQQFSLTLSPGEIVEIIATTAYISDFGTNQPQDRLERSLLDHLDRAIADGFETLCMEQSADLEDFWAGADVDIAGQNKETQAVRLNMFHLYQATGRDGRTSICAKGQTGEGYEGHYFWDAEIFCLPMLAYTRPALARDMLMFRYNSLDHSRHNARMMGHSKGALIAWRTIGGLESSAYFPAGSAQYHINADVAHALLTYFEATNDRDFLSRYGAELLFETARIWDEIGFFNPRKGGAFCINKVTGPDEYTALVDNNFYTNAMARAHLEFASKTAQWMKAHHGPALNALCRKIGLTTTETEGWKKAADAMYLPVDALMNIHPQDDSFLDRERWDITATPAENYPLLLHYHPLTLYRYQVCKQADTVLAMVLQGHRFDTDIKARDLAYYEGVTVHDSTLSAAAFSMLAARLGQTDKALDWFCKAAFVDLDDLHNNTGHGLHMASMGGSWMCLVIGFAGMQVTGDVLGFDPHLPNAWSTLSFRLRFRGRIVSISIEHSACQYQLIDGPPLVITHRGKNLSLSAKQKISAP